jgi:hypothetical protein
MVPSYLFGTALTCHFGTLMQCAQQPRGSSLCGFHVAFHMLLFDAIPDIKKAVVSRIMLNLVSAHIIHLILENDFYLYSHK